MTESKFNSWGRIDNPSSQQVVCPSCHGVGYWDLASMNTAKVCIKCNGTGKVPQQQDELSEGLLLIICPVDKTLRNYKGCDGLCEFYERCETFMLQQRIRELEARVDVDRQLLNKFYRNLNLETIPTLEAEAKAEAYKEILDDIEMHCTQYQWIEKPDFTKRHYPFCPTDLHELKAKYLKSGKPVKNDNTG